MSDSFPSVVLVAEDEPLVRLMVADLLHENGFRVVEAVNAAEALAVLEAGVLVHVLLADVDMPPGLDGYALAHQVRERWPAVEILVTSGRQWPGEGDLPAGAAFLAKPCPTDAMVSHIRAAADRARAARQALETPRQGAEIVPFPQSA